MPAPRPARQLEHPHREEGEVQRQPASEAGVQAVSRRCTRATVGRSSGETARPRRRAQARVRLIPRATPLWQGGERATRSTSGPTCPDRAGRRGPSSGRGLSRRWPGPCAPGPRSAPRGARLPPSSRSPPNVRDYLQQQGCHVAGRPDHVRCRPVLGRARGDVRPPAGRCQSRNSQRVWASSVRGEAGALCGDGLDKPEVLDRDRPASESDRLGNPRQVHARPPKFARVTLAKGGRSFRENCGGGRNRCGRLPTRSPNRPLAMSEDSGTAQNYGRQGFRGD